MESPASSHLLRSAVSMSITIMVLSPFVHIIDFLSFQLDPGAQASTVKLCICFYQLPKEGSMMIIKIIINLITYFSPSSIIYQLFNTNYNMDAFKFCIWILVIHSFLLFSDTLFYFLNFLHLFTKPKIFCIYHITYYHEIYHVISNFV